MKGLSRFSSFLICSITYVVAILVAVVYVLSFGKGQTTLYTTFVADVLATVVVFLFGLAFRNASLYDPYWSVIPMAIVLYWADLFQPYTTIQVLFVVAVWVWGIRLTLNWARGWQGMGHVDWRYSMLQAKSPRWYWLVSLAGIHLFPTLIVFLGILPAYYALFEMKIVMPAVLYIGFSISILAALISLVADEQLRRFKRNADQGAHITTGLWAYSRHPNYFGEILFWFGLWVMAVGVSLGLWWTCVGWIAMAGLFNLISIPMMEKKNLHAKPAYRRYVQQVAKLIPWRRKL
jgi:steroid 5-alpha reductase family enzyme